MKEIKIMSRNEAKTYSAHKEIPESAIISIYSSGDIPCHFLPNERIKAVGRWCIDDVTDDRGITIMQEALSVYRLQIVLTDTNTVLAAGAIP